MSVEQPAEGVEQPAENAKTWDYVDGQLVERHERQTGSAQLGPPAAEDAQTHFHGIGKEDEKHVDSQVCVRRVEQAGRAQDGIPAAEVSQAHAYVLVEDHAAWVNVDLSAEVHARYSLLMHFLQTHCFSTGGSHSISSNYPSMKFMLTKNNFPFRAPAPFVMQ